MVEVTTPGAPARIWTLEMDNRWELAELGFTENTLKPGDRIEVTGDPSRRDANALYVRILRRPADDFRYDHHPTSARLSDRVFPVTDDLHAARFELTARRLDPRHTRRPQATGSDAGESLYDGHLGAPVANHALR